MLKKWFLIIVVSFVILWMFFISGYRFTPLSAAKNNAFVEKDAEMIAEYKLGSSFIYLFKSEQEKMYRTVLTAKSGVFYKSSLSVYIPFRSDAIQTVGSISFTTEDDEGTFLSIISEDENVAYIEIGKGSNLQRKQIKKGQRISFLFTKSEQIDFLSPTAFDKDGKKLYYYGLPEGSNFTNQEDLRWHKFEEKIK
jgi:hypothetical protein